MEFIFDSIFTVFLVLLFIYAITFSTIRIEMILKHKHIVTKKNKWTIIANLIPMILIIIFLMLYMMDINDIRNEYVYGLFAILSLSILIVNTFDFSNKKNKVFKDVYFGKKHVKDEIFKIKSKYVGLEIETSFNDAPIRLTIYNKFIDKMDAYLEGLEKEEQLFMNLITKKYKILAYELMFFYIVSLTFLVFLFYYILTK